MPCAATLATLAVLACAPAPASAERAAYEVQLPDPARDDPRRACTQTTQPSFCAGYQHYVIEDTGLAGASERNAMGLRTTVLTANYTKGERVFASFGYPESSGYDRYR